MLVLADHVGNALALLVGTARALLGDTAGPLVVDTSGTLAGLGVLEVAQPCPHAKTTPTWLLRAPSWMALPSPVEEELEPAELALPRAEAHVAERVWEPLGSAFALELVESMSVAELPPGWQTTASAAVLVGHSEVVASLLPALVSRTDSSGGWRLVEWASGEAVAPASAEDRAQASVEVVLRASEGMVPPFVADMAPSVALAAASGRGRAPGTCHLFQVAKKARVPSLHDVEAGAAQGDEHHSRNEQAGDVADLVALLPSARSPWKLLSCLSSHRP